MTAVTPFSLRDAPSLIERLLPAQKISTESQKERKSVHGQTLTTLGSYWKGRKPLILAKACVLGALLPATEDPEKDLEIFEKLMAIDEDSFVRREPSLKASEVARRALDAQAIDEHELRDCFTIALATFGYLEKLDVTKRPEQCDAGVLYGPIWDAANAHLNTSARSFPELVEQLGVMRFGRRPVVGDTFCGGGSIPFEAARLGCDVFASDLNPIACLLTWGALHIVGGDAKTRERITTAQASIVNAVDRELEELGIEHDEHGNRAKAYLWCLETRCPQTGWLVPLATTWVISKNYRTCARLVPDYAHQRFDIEIVRDATADDLNAAIAGTVADGELVYELDGETYRTPIPTLRGDYRLPDGTSGNRLRRWEKEDIVPRLDDVFQERLYCIQWITKETLEKFHPTFFFAAATQADFDRERKIEAIVRENLAEWQAEGLVPDMQIEPGDETTRLQRERGWTYWHHLFSPRHLLIGALIRKQMLRFTGQYDSIGAAIGFCRALNYMSKLTQWLVGYAGREGVAPSADTVKHVFYNQALNTFFNFGARAFHSFDAAFSPDTKAFPIDSTRRIEPVAARDLGCEADMWITDPPYADAVNYHEITEYFIAWLRRNPPMPDWIWDSRRALAIRGSDDDFRRGMIDAYRAMAEHMPDNGLQIVMFTHQDASVWADMAAIMWGAGLQVTAAWYIATETTSELKKGGYVQGTVLLVLRKRRGSEAVYRDELVQQVRDEVSRQIDVMVGLNQTTRGHGRSENLFEDADLQMAGYAAALRVLTGYTRIDGRDMTAEALRPRQKGETSLVNEIIDFAVQVANEHLVPEGLPGETWERLQGSERFFLKMLALEAAGLKKLDNYQNFAKAFRVPAYTALLGSLKPNAARLKTASEFRKSEFEGEFGQSLVRAVMFALYELENELDIDEVMGHLRDLVPGYHTRRADLLAITRYIAAQCEQTVPAQAQAARILLTRIKNERLGG
ncbi:MAG: DUF1156 domain-containing protein [Planctomycetota bacterium]|nr:DUF1156 domain-containing protein [Planctomycetota bacterium]